MPVRGTRIPWRVAVVLFAPLAPSPVAAQFARHYIALSVGATHNDLTDYLDNLGWRWGGTAGVQAGLVTFDHAYLELAPAWTQMGGGRIRLDYVNVPLMLGGLLAASRDVFVRPYGGIGLSVRFGCRADPTSACDLARRTVWSVPFGLSVVKVLTRGELAGLDVRYVLGVTNVFDVTDATQRSWQFRLLFGWLLGRR
jgi:hypothetical protein